MDVFGRGTDEPSRPLLPPGICWICENSPQQEGMKVIDTRRNARAGGSMSHEAVRKYICEPCARECGSAVGMVTPEEYAEAEAEIKDQSFTLIALNERLEAAEAGQVKVVSVKDIEDAYQSVSISAPVIAEISESFANVLRNESVPSSAK
jgi:hypothetical protein